MRTNTPQILYLVVCVLWCWCVVHPHTLHIKVETSSTWTKTVRPDWSSFNKDHPLKDITAAYQLAPGCGMPA